MFTPKPHTKSPLENAIDDVLREMETLSADSDEYAKMVDQLVKLHAMKTNESRPRISPDTLANIVANLAGIGIIVGHEHAHVITTKALGFIRKLG